MDNPVHGRMMSGGKPVDRPRVTNSLFQSPSEPGYKPLVRTPPLPCFSLTNLR